MKREIEEENFIEILKQVAEIGARMYEIGIPIEKIKDQFEGLFKYLQNEDYEKWLKSA